MSFPNDESRSAFLSIIMEALSGLGERESFWPSGGDERKVARQGMTSKSSFSFHADCPPFCWLRS